MDTQRSETRAEKMDRNWSELLQELRVTQTGVQILSGFLLTLPFQARFTHLDHTQEALYLVAIGLGTVATGSARGAGQRAPAAVPPPREGRARGRG